MFNNEGAKLFAYISGYEATCNLKLVAKFAHSILTAPKNKIQSKNKFLDGTYVNFQCIFQKSSIFTQYAGRPIRNIKVCQFQTGSRNNKMSYIKTNFATNFSLQVAS